MSTSDTFEESVINLSGVENQRKSPTFDVEDPLDVLLQLLRTKSLFGKNQEITCSSFPQLSKDVMWKLWVKGAIKIEFPNEYAQTPIVEYVNNPQQSMFQEDPWGIKMFRS